MGMSLNPDPRMKGVRMNQSENSNILRPSVAIEFQVNEFMMGSHQGRTARITSNGIA